MGRKLKAIESKIDQAQKQLEEAIKELAEYKKAKKLPKPEIGATIEIMDLTWMVLDKTEKGYLCIAESIDNERKFDSRCNDWKKSELREYLNIEFYHRLAVTVGQDNIIPFERDLLSLDGQTEYGTCEDKVSLLTVDEYRKYRSLLPNTQDYWWWLCSPWSTPCNGYEKTVTVVSPSGNFRDDIYDYDYGVRPFCIFSSAIFESEDK